MAFFNRRSAAKRAADKERESIALDDPSAVGHNLVAEDEMAAAPQTENEPNSTKGTLEGIGGFKFVTEDDADFTPPQFSATLDNNVPRVDVTAPDDVVADVPASALEAARESLEMARESLTPPEPDPLDTDSAPVKQHLNLGSLREDIGRITADISTDIEEGDALFRRAQKRVEGLMTFVEKAELDYTAINRLEPENRRLKAKHEDLIQELDAQTVLYRTLQENVANQRRQLVDTQGLLDDSRRKLATTTSAVKRREDDLKKALRAVDQLTTKLERQGISAEVESSENATLRQKLRELSGVLTKMNQDKLAQAKMVDSLRADYEALRSSKGVASSTVDSLKAALSASKKRNSELVSHLESLQGDIKAFKTQYEFNLTNRDKRIIRLESDIEKLERQMMIKEEVIAESAKSVTEMRDRKDNQELDYVRLEKIISDQSLKLNELRQSLSDSEQQRVTLERRQADQRDVAKSDEAERLTAIVASQKQQLSNITRDLTQSEQQRAAAQQRLAQQSQQSAKTGNGDYDRLKAIIATQKEDLSTVKRTLEQSEKQRVTAEQRLAQQGPDTSADDYNRLAQIIATQKADLAEAQQKLAAKNLDIRERDAHYSQVSKALEEAQVRLNQQQTPDITPAVQAPPPQKAPPEVHIDEETIHLGGTDSPFEQAETANLTEESMEDMILDYKLGLRSKIG